MPLSDSARRAQSRLANATRIGADPDDLRRLRVAFRIERAIDALRAIGPVADDDRAELRAAVDALDTADGGEGR